MGDLLLVLMNIIVYGASDNFLICIVHTIIIQSIGTQRCIIGAPTKDTVSTMKTF